MTPCNRGAGSSEIALFCLMSFLTAPNYTHGILTYRNDTSRYEEVISAELVTWRCSIKTNAVKKIAKLTRKHPCRVIKLIKKDFDAGIFLTLYTQFSQSSMGFLRVTLLIR